jgi:hypothetical protein
MRKIWQAILHGIGMNCIACGTEFPGHTPNCIYNDINKGP